MTRDEFDAAVTAYATTKRKGPVSNVLEDSELRWYYERAYRTINEAEVQGPHHALMPVVTCDGGRIWLRPYWTAAGLAFATQNAASRCFRGAVESAFESIFRDEQAKWEKLYLSLPDDDARRESLVSRLKAQGYSTDQIDDIVTFHLERDWSGQNSTLGPPDHPASSCVPASEKKLGAEREKEEEANRGLTLTHANYTFCF